MSTRRFLLPALPLLPLHLPAAVLVALAVVGVAAGCAEEELTPSDEACEHAQKGPASAATASTVADSTAGDVSAEHTRHDIAFVAVDGGNGGFVQLDAEGGELGFFLTADVPLALFDGNAAPVAIEERLEETTCPEVIVSHHVELPVGKVFLSFGPTTENGVSLLVEPLGEHTDGEVAQ